MESAQMKKKTLFIALISILLCSCHNYEGWHKEVIPTNSEYKASIKIPDEWHFESNDDIVSIKDQEGNEIAVEIYEDNWANGFKGPIYINDTVKINEIEGYDICNEGNYKLDYLPSNGASLHKYEDGSYLRYLIVLKIYATFDEDYYFSMFFLNEMEIEMIRKIMDSYQWGGRIEE